MGTGPDRSERADPYAGAVDLGGDPLDAAVSRGDARAARQLIAGCGDAERALEQLAPLAAAGSPLAVELLVETLDGSGLVRRFVSGVLVDEDAVDEVTQDTLISVTRSIGTFGGASKFTTWLHRVAHNRAVDHLRRQRAAVPLDPDTQGPAERISSLIATRQSIRQMLERLPEQYRRAVTMRDVEGLSYEEISTGVGLNVNTLKSHVARGRALMAAMIDREGM
jgi:RNA polymerase sigma-70 factor (ECF subfamily)